MESNCNTLAAEEHGWKLLSQRFNVCSRSRDLWDACLMTSQCCAVFQPRRVCFREWQSSAYFCHFDVSPRKHCSMYVFLCCVVYDSCTQWYAHTHTWAVSCWFWFSFVCDYLGLAFCMFLFELRLFCSCAVCFCCVRFSFFSTTPRDCLGRTSPKWHILCRVGRKSIIHAQCRWSVSYAACGMTLSVHPCSESLVYTRDTCTHQQPARYWFKIAIFLYPMCISNVTVEISILP